MKLSSLLEIGGFAAFLYGLSLVAVWLALVVGGLAVMVAAAVVDQ